MKKYTVYVKVNSDMYITEVNSSAFLTDITGWVEIDRGSGDRYHHAHGNYFDKPILTDGGAYRYKLADDVPVECTAEEITAQEAALNNSATAPRNITAGEYVTVNGVLYKAIFNIPNGERIIVGQNAIETTIEQQLYELTMKGE